MSGLRCSRFAGRVIYAAILEPFARGTRPISDPATDLDVWWAGAAPTSLFKKMHAVPGEIRKVVRIPTRLVVRVVVRARVVDGVGSVDS